MDSQVLVACDESGTVGKSKSDQILIIGIFNLDWRAIAWVRRELRLVQEQTREGGCVRRRYPL